MFGKASLDLPKVDVGFFFDLLSLSDQELTSTWKHNSLLRFLSIAGIDLHKVCDVST